MVMSLRVSELQVLLGYAGRNKHGRKHELLTKALHLLKAGCSPAVQMKIKELYRRRFPLKILTPADFSLSGVHSSTMPANMSPSSIPQLSYDGHPASSPLLPVSLLGPKHELDLPHLTSSLHPVHPDIKLQKLPFYDLLDELIKPTSLASDNSQRFQETCFAFALTPQQVQQISSSMDISGTKCDFTVQVQLRFCLSETSCPQEDHFPPNLCVKINGKPCNLPGYLPPTKNGVEPKRPSRPINITSLVRLSTTVPNTIVVSWTAEIGRNFSLAVYLVKQLSSSILFQRLRAKGIRNPDHSRALIKEKLTADPDSEIATTSLRVSLLCPLGKMRLAIPCRSLTCSHLQCFDATLYIQMNEKKPTWVCPVCDKKAPYEHLIIDGLFMEILKCCTDCDEIQFKEDGSWSPMRSKKEVQEVTTSLNGVDSGCISSTVEHQVSPSQPSNKSKKVEVIDLTIDSSSDEEEEEPCAKRSCPSITPASPLNNKGMMSLPHQTSPISRTPSLPAVDSTYINTPLLQDYRHPFHMTPMPYDLQGLDFFPFLSGENQHYNTSLLAAAAAAASEEPDLLHSSRFFPYATSQLFLDQLSAGVSASLPATNGSNSGSNSSLVSSNSLRESHSAASRGPADSSSLYGIIPDVISLD
ncbi:E3 SUMO-protein ligase PIAS1 isoform X1 [Bufo gargarizans]|uniref:E3 SUMO-protein ligase PIAS1 n=2 Tax=Bufo TaxID=8383 RepID=UPI001ABED6C0|nr:E3 SUMO-protein ligase PIAS1 [Bufo bufo]XP_040270250.1 E3 SUMO-protein ligase PIAS1 [Bufo bufo]XP_044139078.1 E3 SUMO-protein ligase PIAS1 isoform X1 [Bufo gargarizans]XP_044139079.1 E3 SUMO-protein ligase PIAS1 isoform X1 [Bufo gargarizans]XP_044139080.1 E3 SUMO-protein ligase PIAS1 isoform X1 [Bufo gargarizans]